MIRFTPQSHFDTSGLIIFLTEEQWKDKKFPAGIPDSMRSAITDVYALNQFSAKKNELYPVNLKKQIIILVGLGGKKEASAATRRIATRNVFLSQYVKKIKNIDVFPSEQNIEAIHEIIEGICIGTYSWTKYQSKNDTNDEINNKSIAIISKPKSKYSEILTICNGVTLTRDLVNDNADIVTATYMENKIREIIKGYKNASLTILGKKELKSKGLNLHLAVNQGSTNEPKLIIVKYNGGAKKDKLTALIGKGITFDSGGLNVKTSGHIETMRCDMAGAAALAGVLKNILALKVKKNILFVFGMAENAIGSKSYKPGDIIRSYSGKTVEIANTDAEGRLVLADAIAYTAKNYSPQMIIDIATLTGACIVALGYDYTGLVSDNQKLATKLLQAAAKTDDRTWQLPFYPELKDSVKSQVADIRNLGLPRGAAGTLTAAEFLRQFAQDIAWAHLDIAGTSFIEEKSHLYYSYGATGAGVRLLTEFLKNC